MREKLLKLLEKALNNNNLDIAQMLLDAIVALENGKQIICYVSDFTEPIATDDIYDTYEYMYKNIIN